LELSMRCFVTKQDTIRAKRVTLLMLTPDI